jgi:hypothetical protein
MRIFAERLKEERAKAKLTHQDIANQLNITRGAYLIGRY